jgi:hypothetical protein
MSDADDGGLPEETKGAQEQSNAVNTPENGPWKNSANMWTFQNEDDLKEHVEDVLTGSNSPVMVLLIDNEDLDVPMFPKNKHYWIIDPPTAVARGVYSGEISITHLSHTLVTFLEEGLDISQIKPFGGGEIKLGKYKGAPVWVRDPAIDDSRPDSQTSSTTGKTSGNTIITTTIAKPGTAGVSTESTTDLGLDAFGGAGAAVTPPNAAGAIPKPAEVAELPPCLPDNTGIGSGSVPPKVSAAKAAKDKLIGAVSGAKDQVTSAIGGYSGPGSSVAAGAAGAAGAVAGAAGAVAGAATTTAPTIVSSGAAAGVPSAAESTAPGLVTPNVYIYETITPGFDRYDFNTGKKVYTPDTGPSRNAASQPLTGPQ